MSKIILPSHLVTPHILWEKLQNAGKTNNVDFFQKISELVEEEKGETKWQTWEYVQVFDSWAHLRNPVLSKKNIGCSNWRDEIPKELQKVKKSEGERISTDPHDFLKCGFNLGKLGIGENHKMETLFWRVSLPSLHKSVLD